MPSTEPSAMYPRPRVAESFPLAVSGLRLVEDLSAQRNSEPGGSTLSVNSARALPVRRLARVRSPFAVSSAAIAHLPAPVACVRPLEVHGPHVAHAVPAAVILLPGVKPYSWLLKGLPLVRNGAMTALTGDAGTTPLPIAVAPDGTPAPVVVVVVGASGDFPLDEQPAASAASASTTAATNNRRIRRSYPGTDTSVTRPDRIVRSRSGHAATSSSV
jgi:hypothetical protein